MAFAVCHIQRDGRLAGHSGTVSLAAATEDNLLTITPRHQPVHHIEQMAYPVHLGIGHESGLLGALGRRC